MATKIPTAEEFLDLHSSNYDYFNEELDFIKFKMIEFAKLHVEAALKEAAKNAKIEDVSVSTFYNKAYYKKKIVKKSILNAYPLENIK
jgi:hypothetical protein